MPLARHIPAEKPEDKIIEADWARIHNTIVFILENDQFLKPKINNELILEVIKKFGVNDEKAQTYISEAKREVRKISRLKKDKAFSKAIRDREFIIAKAKADEDYKLALDAIKDRDKLLSLYDEVKPQEITVKNIDMNRFTEFGLERIKHGDKIEEILLDPRSVKQERREL
jgi:hypothetical protein